MNIIVKELFSLISILGNKFFVAMLVNTLHRQLMHFPAIFGLFWALFAYFGAVFGLSSPSIWKIWLKICLQSRDNLCGQICGCSQV